MSCTITATEFKDHFDRGPWTYGPTLPDVRDSDIEKAITEALAVFNGDLYETEAVCKLALTYLTAHFLTLDLESADGDGAPVHNQTSRSVGSVSESVTIPEWMLEGEFSMYVTTQYGIKWLQLTKPYLGGSVYAVQGGTQF